MLLRFVAWSVVWAAFWFFVLDAAELGWPTYPVAAGILIAGTLADLRLRSPAPAEYATIFGPGVLLIVLGITDEYWARLAFGVALVVWGAWGYRSAIRRKRLGSGHRAPAR